LAKGSSVVENVLDGVSKRPLGAPWKSATGGRRLAIASALP